MYENPTANNVPIGPSQRASIATNFESPLPRASFLKMYLAKFLKASKSRNDTAEQLSAVRINNESKFFSLKTAMNNIAKIPEMNPKFINP